MKFLLAILVLALSGCAALKPDVKYVTQAPEKVLMPAEPSWVVLDLQDTASVAEQLRAMRATALQCIGYVDELKTTFRPYTKDQDHGTAPAQPVRGEDAPH